MADETNEEKRRFHDLTAGHAESVDYEDEDDEDEDDARKLRLLSDLFDIYMDAFEETNGLLLQDAVIRFAALASHMCLYEVAELARDENESPEKAAEGFVRVVTKDFAEALTNTELLRTVAGVLGEPELNLHFSRKFRRTL